MTQIRRADRDRLSAKIKEKLTGAFKQRGKLAQIDYHKTFIQFSYLAGSEVLSVIIYAKRGQIVKDFVDFIRSCVEAHSEMLKREWEFKGRVCDQRTAWWGEYYFRG